MSYRMFDYAREAREFADTVREREERRGSTVTDARAMAAAALVEAATRLTLECCEMGRDDFLHAIGEHFDLVRASMSKAKN